ncbi:acetyltransferase, GNAT family domain protein [Burkholderia pseudomallei]|nr:acetyltransferase, GNAT family domain protein [Burkholderia pseudomallei]
MKSMSADSGRSVTTRVRSAGRSFGRSGQLIESEFDWDGQLIARHCVRGAFGRDDAPAAHPPHPPHLPLMLRPPPLLPLLPLVPLLPLLPLLPLPP